MLSIGGEFFLQHPVKSKWHFIHAAKVIDLEGTHLADRFSILNAYYFPDGNYDDLYQSISPVNTFRVLFNRYLGADLELLEDRCLWHNLKKPYHHIEVTDRLRPRVGVVPAHAESQAETGPSGAKVKESPAVDS